MTGDAKCFFKSNGIFLLIFTKQKNHETVNILGEAARVWLGGATTLNVNEWT